MNTIFPSARIVVEVGYTRERVSRFPAKKPNYPGGKHEIINDHKKLEYLKEN